MTLSAWSSHTVSLSEYASDVSHAPAKSKGMSEHRSLSFFVQAGYRLRSLSVRVRRRAVIEPHESFSHAIAAESNSPMFLAALKRLSRETGCRAI